MITYINERLNQWVEWRLKGRRIAGLGYPGCANFYKLAPLPSRAMTPIPDEACFEIDQAVCWLRKHHKDLYKIILLFNWHNYTATLIAGEFDIHRDTVYSRIHRAHVLIMEYLQDAEDEAADSVRRFG